MKTENLLLAVLGSVLKVTVAVVAVFLVYKGAATCYEYGYRIFTEPPMTNGEGRTVSVTVEPDMSAMDMGKLLESKGLSRDRKLCALQYICSEYKEDIAPGTYEVTTAMTVEEIFAAMVPKETQEEPVQ